MTQPTHPICLSLSASRSFQGLNYHLLSIELASKDRLIWYFQGFIRNLGQKIVNWVKQNG